MVKHILILPAINANTFEEIEKKIRVAEDILKYEPSFRHWVHIDVADGSASAVKRWHNPKDLHHLSSTLNVELHLMEQVDKKRFLAWCDHHVRRIFVHAELVENMTELIALARERRVELGLAVFRDTDMAIIEPYLAQVTGILLLSVTPGMSGEGIDLTVLERIRKVREVNSRMHITLDGGVRVGIARSAVEKGATRLVAASAIFATSNPKESYEHLVHDAESALG